MPELPDLIVYMDALTRRVMNTRLERIAVRSPFVLRSVEPSLDTVFGQKVTTIERVGKRLVLGFEPDLFLVIHLMIAGRLRWFDREGTPAKPPSPKLVLATLEFEHGTLIFTEASSKKRASMRMVRGRDALRAIDPGGIEPLSATREEFQQALVRENHTVKRALTDPRLFSGIGNAYSDEILHAAKLSPLKLTGSLLDEEIVRVFDADANDASRVDRSTARADRRRFSREGDGLSCRDGGPRPLQEAVSRLRCAGPADRLRRQRVQLLRPVPDRRPRPGRSIVVALAEGRLAAKHRRPLNHNVHGKAHHTATKGTKITKGTKKIILGGSV